MNTRIMIHQDGPLFRGHWSDHPDVEMTANSASEVEKLLIEWRFNNALSTPPGVMVSADVPPPSGKVVSLTIGDSIVATEKNPNDFTFHTFTRPVKQKLANGGEQEITIACWRHGNPAVQGYGNDNNQAKADLLTKEQSIASTIEPPVVKDEFALDQAAEENFRQSGGEQGESTPSND